MGIRSILPKPLESPKQLVIDGLLSERDLMKGGKRYSKINQSHRDFIIQEIERNPRITLQEVVDKIFQTFQLRTSKPTISNHIDSMLYSLKTLETNLKRQILRSINKNEKILLKTTFLSISKFAYLIYG